MEKRIPRRRFKEFVGSGEWEEKKLGEVAETFSGGTPTAGNLSYYGGKIPFIRSGEIDSDKTKIFITEKGLKNSSAKNIKKGNILYALYGATSGEVSISKINGAINQAILAIIPSKGYNNKFIVEWLRFNKYKIINTYLQGGQGNLSSRIIKSIVIKFPTLAEQEKIGNFFQKLDRLIEVNREKLVKLKACKSAYLEEMFPREGEDRPRRRFQGFTGAWEEKKFEEIFIYIRNNSLSRANLNYESGFIKNIHYGDILVKYKETLDVQNSILPYISNNYYSNKLLSSCLQNGDIVIADAAEDEIVGKCTEIYNLQDEKIVAGLHTIACRPIKRFEKWYLGYFINSNSYHDQLIGLMQGTKVESISKTSLKETYLKFPSLAEQEKIGNFFKKLDQQIEVQEERLEKLEKMKKAYLAEMFV